MTKGSVLILMLCTLAIIVDVAVAGNYGRKHYIDDEEEDSSEEIHELAEKTAKENRMTQEEIRELREELQKVTANEHKLTEEEIYRLRDEVERLRAEEERHHSNWGGEHHHSGGLLGSIFDLKKRILEKNLHFLGK